MTETLSVVKAYDLCSGIGIPSGDNLGCSTPHVVGDALHLVLNAKVEGEVGHEKIGYVDNYFVSVQLGNAISLGNDAHERRAGSPDVRRKGGTMGAEVPIRYWRSRSQLPVRAIQPLDHSCSSVLYAQGRHFCIATEVDEVSEYAPSNGRHEARERGTSDRPEEHRVGGKRKSVIEDTEESNGERRGGQITKSLDVHMGNIADFRVNPESRHVLSGGDNGHVHVLSFSPDMGGVPDMKVSKYVGCPVSSVRWHPTPANMASWTTSKGHLQMLDIRDNRVVVSIQAEGQPPVMTHEHVSEYVVAVGHDSGRVQLFDVRKVLAFLTVQDPVSDTLRQLVPLGGDTDVLRDGGVSGWATLGTGGVSRYSVRAIEIEESGLPAVESSRIDAVANGAAEVSLDAWCRTNALDLDAGLFITSWSGQDHDQQSQTRGSMFAITRDAHVVTFAEQERTDDDSSEEKLDVPVSPGTVQAASTLALQAFRRTSE